MLQLHTAVRAISLQFSSFPSLCHYIVATLGKLFAHIASRVSQLQETGVQQESPANAKGTRDSSACMKAHCKQMQNP